MHPRTTYRTVTRYVRLYYLFFLAYLKSRMIYKTSFVLGMLGQGFNLVVSVAFITLVFTRVDTINGWTFTEMLFLLGVGGVTMHLHHMFLWSITGIGNDWIRTGDLDRLLIRPMNPLFQLYAQYIAEDNLVKLVANLALIAYAASQLDLALLTPVNLLYSTLAVANGILVFAAVFLTFATTAFWTGRSNAATWLLTKLGEFNKYPFDIYAPALKLVLTTLVPIAFAAFFPATFLLGREQWSTMQHLSLVVGPAAYYVAYRWWKVGLANYSSTGS